MTEEHVERLVRKVESLEARLAALQVNMLAHEANQRARLKNSHTWRLSGLAFGLEPLHAVATNQPIPNFPFTAAAIGAIGENDANRILRLLGVPLEGNLPEKRRTLKALTGIFG